jgi:hypothetical protein
MNLAAAIDNKIPGLYHILEPLRMFHGLPEKKGVTNGTKAKNSQVQGGMPREWNL